MLSHKMAAFFLACTLALPLSAREIIELSGDGWKLSRDTDAKWQHEHVVPPGTPLSEVTAHAPSGGWDALNKADRKTVVVPGTVEQYFTDMSALEKDYTIPPDEFWKPLQGVSWWSRKITVNEDLTGKKVFLRFASIRYQAEVFLNHELIACDSACDTEFMIDVTGKLKKGEPAVLDVRITNPGGDYDWVDYIPFTWNGVKLNGGRAVGGITGKVTLEVTDPVYIDDVFVMNNPEPKKINTQITVVNTTDSDVEKTLDISILPDKVAIAKQEKVTLKPGENVIERTYTLENAKLWDLETPNLYTLDVTVGKEKEQQIFGFRWFTVDGIGKDAVFRLNGRRVVLRTAISWGWWPVTGTIPLPEYAVKQIKAAKNYGMNMLNFHRHMGQDLLLCEADKQGLMYYVEPGGFISGSQSPEGRLIAKERVRRMVKTFRSHPSLCIYNLINELGLGREKHDMDWYSGMVSFTHQNDPSRTVTLTSAWSKEGINVDDMSKMHSRPYDPKVYLSGFRDNHNAGGPLISWPTYYYKSPTDFLNCSKDKEEIVFWGEEGAISSPPRLDLIVKELKAIGQNGMDGEDYLNWYSRMNKYLDEKGLRKDFPTIDSFTTELGKVAVRHQGRRIEMIRMNNVSDGYAINGWEAMLRENNSGVVDTFRNPKADPAILRAYNAPLKLAVHSAAPTFQAPGKVKADIHIINEENLHGDFTLVVQAVMGGKVIGTAERPVKVPGGETFGELLAQDIEFEVKQGGVGQIKAFLKDTKAAGEVEITAIELSAPKIPAGVYSVYENGSQIRDFLNSTGLKFTAFDPKAGETPRVLVVTQPFPIPARIPANKLSSPDGKNGEVRVAFYDGDKKMAERTSNRLDFSFPNGVSPDPSMVMTSGFTVRIDGSYLPDADGEYLFKIEGPTAETDQLVFSMNGKALKLEANGLVKVPLEKGKPAQMAVSMTKNQAQSMRILCYPPNANSVDVNAVVELAKAGTQVIVLSDATEWAPTIATAGNLKYLGSFRLGNNWVGGQYFCKNHPVFNGFLKPSVLDYPFERMVSNPRTALIMEGKEELIAGAWQSIGCRMGTAIGSVKTGRGSMTYSTLNLTNMNDDAGRKILLNLIEYCANK